MKKINNYINKPISEFTENDTLYFSKVVSGFLITFHVRFIKFEKGIITGEILDIQPNSRTSIWIGKILYEIGDEITNRVSKSYTYNNSCIWFKKDGKNWRC